MGELPTFLAVLGLFLFFGASFTPKTPIERPFLAVLWFAESSAFKKRQNFRLLSLRDVHFIAAFLLKIIL